MQVLTVWEPILPTDWGKPTTGALKRLSDGRVAQFWDKQHVVADRLAQDARDPQPKPGCCKRNGHLWDLAAIYPPGALWERNIPAAVVFDGPVFRLRTQITDTIRPEQNR